MRICTILLSFRMSAATSENTEKAAQKVRIFFVQLAVFGPACSKRADILFCIVIFYGKLLPCAPNAYIIRTEEETACGFLFFPFLLNYVTILLRILCIFCKYFVIRRRTAYEHTV